MVAQFSKLKASMDAKFLELTAEIHALKNAQSVSDPHLIDTLKTSFNRVHENHLKQTATETD